MYDLGSNPYIAGGTKLKAWSKYHHLHSPVSITISQTKELKLNHKFYRHIVFRKAVPAVKN